MGMLITGAGGLSEAAGISTVPEPAPPLPAEGMLICGAAGDGTSTMVSSWESASWGTGVGGVEPAVGCALARAADFRF